MQDWERRWHDKTTEPYVVLHIERKYASGRLGFVWWVAYYRAYQKRSYCVVWAKDELDAFIKATSQMNEARAKSDRAIAAKNKGAS